MHSEAPTDREPEVCSALIMETQSLQRHREHDLPHPPFFLHWQTCSADGCALLLSLGNSKQSILPTHFCESPGFADWPVSRGGRPWKVTQMWAVLLMTSSGGHSHRPSHMVTVVLLHPFNPMLIKVPTTTLSKSSRDRSEGPGPFEHYDPSRCWRVHKAPRQWLTGGMYFYFNHLWKLHYQIKVKFICIYFNRNIHILGYSSL